MVEGAPLLREYTGNGIEGSNPFVSAIHKDVNAYNLLKYNDLGRQGQPTGPHLLYIALYNLHDRRR